MFCNHKSVSVTRNLVEALRTFRHTRKSRVLWADAICINQQDLEERSLQVQLMTRIFSDASRVLIWLGHGDFFLIQVALNYICRCINHYTKDVLSEGEYAQYYWNGKEVDTRNDGASSPEGKIGDFTLKALQYLFGCPYFSRGWVVQEVVLPTTAQIFWGKAQLDFVWLFRAAIYISWQHGAQLPAHTFNRMHTVDTMYRLRYAIHDLPVEYKFSTLLKYTRGQKFSDSKDHVYGLLGLERLCPDLSPERSLFQPDYNVSEFECYKATTETLLIECGDLGIIFLVQHDPAIDHERPSWVPRLDRRLLTEPYYEFWKASGNVKATVSKKMRDGQECMRIKGFRVDRLRTIASKFEFPEDEERLQTLLSRLERRYGTECVAWTASNGISSFGRLLNESPTLESEHLKEFEAYMNWDIEKSLSRFPSPSYHVPGVDAFRDLCCDWLVGRCFFETDEGLLGVGPDFMQPGDHVVILFGGKMPFVLRPVGKLWRLVGACYVYGLMEGEAIERWEHSTKYRVEKFDIF
jgi:hypothetical protein